MFAQSVIMKCVTVVKCRNQEAPAATECCVTCVFCRLFKVEQRLISLGKAVQHFTAVALQSELAARGWRCLHNNNSVMPIVCFLVSNVAGNQRCADFCFVPNLKDRVVVT